MSASSICPKCGKPLPADASDGRCPACVLGMLDEATHLDAGGNETIAGILPMIDPVLSGGGSAAFGDYDLIEEIARGGMGVVYKARQRSLNRIVAVKVILAGRFAGKQLIQRFRGEVMAAALLQHPHIVPVLEVGMHEGQHFFSMNYVEGQNLAELVGNRPMISEKAARYIQKIAEAIHYAHGQGILHRDLKPSNVLIDSATDQPWVTDFGLAKQLGGDSSLTITGQVLGSPNFMPPEQASGNRGKVGRPSDVYGLGAILYYLLTARAPFQADSLQGIVTAVLNGEAVSPRLLSPHVPADLETICLKCLEKEPARRYQTAQELADELGRFLQDEPIHARPVTSTERLWRRCRRKPALASLSAIIVLLGLVFAFGAPIALYRIKHERDRAEEESALRRRQLYASEVNLAGQALANDDLNRARDLLMRQWPEADSTNDLRGFEWRYFYGQCGSEESATLGRHEHAVQAVAFSPSGGETLLASWEANGMVKLWDYRTQKLITVLRDPQPDLANTDPGPGGPSALAFSLDGQWLAAGSGRAILLWNIRTPGRPAVLHGHSNLVNCLVFTRDGKTLASAGSDGSIRFWDMASDNPCQVDSIQSGLRSVWRLALAWDDKTLVASGASPAIDRWDISNREKPISLPLAEEHSGWISALAFGAETNLLVSAGSGGDMITWRFGGDQKLLTLRRLPLPRGSIGIVTSLIFAAESNRLVSAGADANITVWDLSGEQTAIRLKGHLKQITCLAASADGRTIASGGIDGTVKLWDIASAWQSKHALPAMSPGRWVLAVAFSPDGKLLASVDAKHQLQLWDTETERVLIAIRTDAVGADRLAFSPDGKLLATEANGMIQLRRVPSLEDTCNPIPGKRPVFSPDGSELLFFLRTGKQGGIHWRNLNTGKERVWQVECNDLSSLALSADGCRVAVAIDNRIMMAGREDGPSRIVEIGRHADFGVVCGLAFSPNGHLLASAGWDGSVRLWNLDNPRQTMAPLTAHHGRAWAVAFSPDGRTLATGGDDGTIRLWNLPSLQEAAVLNGHTGPVDGLAFSTDGRQLASCSGDGTVRIWRAPSLAEINQEPRARRDGTLEGNALPRASLR
jgi:eukaryotic-like serine/threonine-protein kinase